VFSSALGQRRFGRFVILFAALAMAAILGACAGEPQADPIRLQANAVGGGQLYFEDLASVDTVLWFWAPW